MTIQLQRVLVPEAPRHEVTLTFQYEQIRLLETLLQEGIEAGSLSLLDQNRAEVILNTVSDGRRHVESLRGIIPTNHRGRGRK